MKINKFAGLAVTAVALLSMAACGKNDDSKKESNGKETEITVWVWDAENDDKTTDYQRTLTWANDFNERNKGEIKVKVSGGRMPEDTLTVISSGSTPDIFQNYWNNTPQWADAGAIMDLTDYLKKDSAIDLDDYLPQALAMGQAPDGKQYGLPQSFSTSFLIYNKDWLKEAGYSEAPKTLQELVDMNKKLTEIKDGKVERAGFLPDKPWIENVGWPIATGAHWVSDDGKKITFDTPEMKKAYDTQSQIFKDLGGYDKAQTFSSGFGNTGEAGDAFCSQKVAMLFIPDSMLNSYYEFAKDFDWGVAPFPSDTGEGMLTVNTVNINAKTKHPDEAYKVYSDYMNSKNSIKFQVEGFKNNGKLIPRKTCLQALLDGDYPEQIKVLAKEGNEEKMRGFPSTSFTNEYLDAINSQIPDALAGRQTVEDALKNVQKKMEDVVGR